MKYKQVSCLHVIFPGCQQQQAHINLYKLLVFRKELEHRLFPLCFNCQSAMHGSNAGYDAYSVISHDFAINIYYILLPM